LRKSRSLLDSDMPLCFATMKRQLLSENRPVAQYCFSSGVIRLSRKLASSVGFLKRFRQHVPRRIISPTYRYVGNWSEPSFIGRYLRSSPPDQSRHADNQGTTEAILLYLSPFLSEFLPCARLAFIPFATIVSAVSSAPTAFGKQQSSSQQEKFQRLNSASMMLLEF
jgi:hypothetical protein